MTARPEETATLFVPEVGFDKTSPYSMDFSALRIKIES
jgi:hypothetical protein